MSDRKGELMLKENKQNEHHHLTGSEFHMWWIPNLFYFEIIIFNIFIYFHSISFLQKKKKKSLLALVGGLSFKLGSTTRGLGA